MPIVIPLRNDLPHFDLQVTLESITYVLEFRFNTRERSWYMSILSDDGTYIVSSIKFLIDHPLACRSQNPLKPQGLFLAEDTTGTRSDPTYDYVTQKSDLGDRVILLYFESSELPIDRSV